MKYLSGNVNQTFTIANTKAAIVHNFDPFTSIFPPKTGSLSQYNMYVNILFSLFSLPIGHTSDRLFVFPSSLKALKRGVILILTFKNRASYI